MSIVFGSPLNNYKKQKEQQQKTKYISFVDI